MNAKLNYPCKWTYKIIGTDKMHLYQIASKLLHKEFECTPSNTSKRGKYHSVQIDLIVESQQERDEIFALFQAHPDIEFVL